MRAFDLRDALRGLTRDRLYSFITVLALALTIGATTAVFSIVNGVLLKPLAYRESHQLVEIREVWREIGKLYPTVPVNEQHFEYWRGHALSFASMAEYEDALGNLTGSGEAAQVTVVRATGTLFDVLQTPAALGRVLSVDDERMDREDVAVVSDSLWRQRLGGEPGVLDRPIVLDGKPYTVVGVLPPGFELPQPSDLGGGERLTSDVDVFVPLHVKPSSDDWAGDHNAAALGRLKPGIGVEAARAELDVLQRQVSAIATERAHETVTLRGFVMPLTDAVVGGARRGLLLLLAAIAAVLLIACSNLASLSLTRTAGRLREAAIRSALGAGRRRLVGRVLLEQLLLAVTGGALGVVVARGALAVFVRTAPVGLPRVNEVALDGHVLAFAAFVSVAAGCLVALLPAWRIAGRDLQTTLRGGGHGATGDGLGAHVRSGLLALQIALSVMLLVVTALLGLSFVRLIGVDRGFSTDHVLAIDLALPASRYASPDNRVAAYDRVLAAVHTLPGVDAATWTSRLPFSGERLVTLLRSRATRVLSRSDPTRTTGSSRPSSSRRCGCRSNADMSSARSTATLATGARPGVGEDRGRSVARPGPDRQTLLARPARRTTLRGGRRRRRRAHDRDRDRATADGLCAVLVAEPHVRCADDSHGGGSDGARRRCPARARVGRSGDRGRTIRPLDDLVELVACRAALSGAALRRLRRGGAAHRGARSLRRRRLTARRAAGAR